MLDYIARWEWMRGQLASIDALIDEGFFVKISFESLVEPSKPAIGSAPFALLAT